MPVPVLPIAADCPRWRSPCVGVCVHVCGGNANRISPPAWHPCPVPLLSARSAAVMAHDAQTRGPRIETPTELKRDCTVGGARAFSTSESHTVRGEG